MYINQFLIFPSNVLEVLVDYQGQGSVMFQPIRGLGSDINWFLLVTQVQLLTLSKYRQETALQFNQKLRHESWNIKTER